MAQFWVGSKLLGGCFLVSGLVNAGSPSDFAIGINPVTAVLKEFSERPDTFNFKVDSNSVQSEEFFSLGSPGRSKNTLILYKIGDKDTLAEQSFSLVIKHQNITLESQRGGYCDSLIDQAQKTSLECYFDSHLQVMALQFKSSVLPVASDLTFIVNGKSYNSCEVIKANVGLMVLALSPLEKRTNFIDSICGDNPVKWIKSSSDNKLKVSLPGDTGVISLKAEPLLSDTSDASSEAYKLAGFLSMPATPRKTPETEEKSTQTDSTDQQESSDDASSKSTDSPVPAIIITSDASSPGGGGDGDPPRRPNLSEDKASGDWEEYLLLIEEEQQKRQKLNELIGKLAGIYTRQDLTANQKSRKSLEIAIQMKQIQKEIDQLWLKHTMITRKFQQDLLQLRTMQAVYAQRSTESRMLQATRQLQVFSEKIFAENDKLDAGKKKSLSRATSQLSLRSMKIPSPNFSTLQPSKKTRSTPN